MAKLDTIEAKRKEFERLYNYFGPEDKLHIKCSFFLWEYYPEAVWFHPPNEGKREWFNQSRVKLMGVKPGVPDFIIMEPNYYHFGLVMEAKTSNGRLDPAQKMWLDELRKKGFKAEVFRDFETFTTIVQSYFECIPL